MTNEFPSNVPQPADLLALKTYRMPFGRYQEQRLIDLPEAYLVWWRQQGWPQGRLGLLMQLVFEMKINGLTKLVDRLPNS